MDKMGFLRENRKIYETSIEFSKDRIREMEEKLAVINEIISEIEGREDNANAAQ